jgi:hypothetical protein
VTGITKTNNNHESILAEVGDSDRFSVTTGDEGNGKKFKNIVFCAPPSGFDDYPAAIEDCITNLWAGPSEGGVFVFTSSGGMYVDSKADENWIVLLIYRTHSEYRLAF